MPAASSIYWNSVDSARSSGSSGDTGSARQYIDPWDLENYAYLRRHSIATPPQKCQTPHQRTSYSRVSHRREPEPEYWYSPVREPGYHAPASVEEIYFKPRQTSQYQPIYEDEAAMPRYSIYAPVSSDLDHAKQYEELRWKEELRRRKLSREIYGRERSNSHNSSSNTRRVSVDEVLPRMIKGDEECYVEVMPPSNIGLNNYGHLKIDYTNSWNSLHRKISK